MDSLDPDFVGREEELTQLAGLLRHARLITVTGPGGVGKTSVALRATSQASDRYPDGAWVVQLSGLSDPELLPNTVASALGLPEDTRSPLDAVLDHLGDRQMLLVFDTCEHLIDACANLAEAIIARAGNVTILATSRQPLDIAGEHTYPVQPLPLPDAVALFRLRARLVVPGFEVGDDNRRVVTGICKRLDGIPLAIVLVAVRLRDLPVWELAQMVDSHFAMQVPADGPPVPRHQTLRTAIEWSYHLCSPLEQALWQRLSLFADWFDLEAVEEVCAESEPERAEALQAMYDLIDKSVVLRESPSSARYRLLDTIREFGAERLLASGDSDRWRRRHFARYLRLARGFRDHFASDEQMGRYHGLRDEHPNIRAALEYTLAGLDSSRGPEPSAGSALLATINDLALAGMDLVNSLALYWMISSRQREGGYWLGKGLEYFRSQSTERAATLVTRGLLRSFEGYADGSIEDCQEAIAIASLPSIDGPDLVARAYLHMQLSLTFAGRHDEAEAAGNEARTRLTACGDRVGLLMLDTQMGHLYQLMGQLDKALETAAHGLELLGEGSRERWLQSYLYIVSSFALFQIPGREAECAAYASQALVTKNELGDAAGIAYAMETLAWLATRAERHTRTAWLIGAADPQWKLLGSRFGGTAIMEQIHQGSIAAATAALGAQRYRSLFDLGASLPVDDVVAAAVVDADELPSLLASFPLAAAAPPVRRPCRRVLTPFASDGSFRCLPWDDRVAVA
ncbi:MAG TPA: AAA family ATPase [Trebonia sp.]|nr:AAA family ATPase [Trebonia sp.]